MNVELLKEIIMKALPKKLLNSKALENAQEKCDNVQEILQKYVMDLSGLMNIRFESFEQLEGATPKWLDDQIEKSKTSLRAVFGAGGGFIPSGISKQFADNYADIRNRALPIIDGIQANLKWCKTKGIGIKIDSKGKPWLNEKDVKEAVTKYAEYTFSEDQNTYYTLLCKVFGSIDEICSYEESQGLEVADIPQIISEWNTARVLSKKKKFDFTPEDFLGLINWGKVCRKKLLINTDD